MSNHAEVKIRVAELKDCHKIAEVHINSWKIAYSGLLSELYLNSLELQERAAMWDKILKADFSKTHVAVAGDDVLGFISIGPANDIPEENRVKDSGCIYAFYVAPQFWRKGYGFKLLRYAVTEMNGPYSRLFLWVIADNIVGRNFYVSRGFKSHGVFKEEETEPGNPLKEELFSKSVEEIHQLL